MLSTTGKSNGLSWSLLCSPYLNLCNISFQHQRLNGIVLITSCFSSILPEMRGNICNLYCPLLYLILAWTFPDLYLHVTCPCVRVVTQYYMYFLSSTVSFSKCMVFISCRYICKGQPHQVHTCTP